MSEPQAREPGTVRLHRVIRSTPERIYQAFLTPAAMVKWLPPHGFTATVHELDARVGGRYRMSFTDFASGHGHSFGGTYLALEPGRLLRYSAQFDSPGLPGEMTTTVTLSPVSCGTMMTVEQCGIPFAVPLESCHLGWQESVQLLTLLLEGAPPP